MNGSQSKRVSQGDRQTGQSGKARPASQSEGEESTGGQTGQQTQPPTGQTDGQTEGQSNKAGQDRVAEKKSGE